MKLNIKNETANLKIVILGQHYSMGGIPDIGEVFDPKSYESVNNKEYPSEENVAKEICTFENILLKYNVEILKPLIIKNYNQIFTRDVSFVIDDTMIIPKMISFRAAEKDALKAVYEKISDIKKIILPDEAKVEGGDVVLHNEYVFIGVSESNLNHLKSARTNMIAFNILKELFPQKIFIPLRMIKNDKYSKKNILHLDCGFMTLSNNKAIVYKNGFVYDDDYQIIVDIFGRENIYEMDQTEMSNLCANIFSISPGVVVSEKNAVKLNQFMKDNWNLKVEEIAYSEIMKMGGSLHCTTQPLVREDE
jgi:N-dimethylarginine dimethylaminohydrolase